MYRLEDIPYSGVICNIISYFFLRSAYSPLRTITLTLRHFGVCVGTGARLVGHALAGGAAGLRVNREG